MAQPTDLRNGIGAVIAGSGTPVAAEAARRTGRLFRLATGVLAVALGASDGPLAAAEVVPPPTEALLTQEIAPGVFVYQAPYQLLAPQNGGAIANVGFVVGHDAVAVIDTGNTLDAGRRLLAAVRARTTLPIRYVVNTHMHPDHVLGDAAFRDEGVTFVAHAKFAEALRARAESYLAAGKRAMGDGFEPKDVVLPDIAVADARTIDLGGRILDLQAEPAAHTNNDLTIFDRSSGTWFLGDLLFLGHLPSIDGSLEGWLKVMSRVKARPVARVVPGHGPASAPWPESLVPQQRYFDKLRADVKAELDAGADIRQASEKAGLSERDAWALFDEFNTRNAIAAYREMEWE